MEKLKMFAMYDLKAERYDTPFFSLNNVHAERRFVTACQDPSTMIYRFKNDFQLHYLGVFDILDGTFKIDVEEDLITLEGKDIDNTQEAENKN
jgi:hypothetical protein